jgi:hypothetical protein
LSDSNYPDVAAGTTLSGNISARSRLWDFDSGFPCQRSPTNEWSTAPNCGVVNLIGGSEIGQMGMRSYANRSIELIGFGRQPPSYHEVFQRAFHTYQSPLFTCARRLAPSLERRWRERPMPRSPGFVTSRWFESLASSDSQTPGGGRNSKP